MHCGALVYREVIGKREVIADKLLAVLRVEEGSEPWGRLELENVAARLVPPVGVNAARALLKSLVDENRVHVVRRQRGKQAAVYQLEPVGLFAPVVSGMIQ